MKKFAKPELKACIEEFEEKINKFHIEKKELEITAKNAEAHQQKVQILENIRVSKEDGEESTGSETSGGWCTHYSRLNPCCLYSSKLSRLLLPLFHKKRVPFINFTNFNFFFFVLVRL